MREFRLCTLALAALMVWNAPAPARAADVKKKPVPGAGAVQVILLRHKSVRDELKLTDDETKKIYDFTEKQWKKAQQVNELPAKERDRKFDEMTRENEKFIDEVLEPDQRKRLNQITLQVAGLLWVSQPDVASALKLTDEQKTKIVALHEEALIELEDLLHSNASTEQRHAKVREINQSCKRRLVDLLDDQQEARYKEMVGPPFKGELRFDEDATDAPAPK